MKILSKRHSSEVIKQLRLNGVPEKVFTSFDEQAIRSFCEKWFSTLYILRDVTNPSGKYFLCKNVDECIESAKKYEESFLTSCNCVEELLYIWRKHIIGLWKIVDWKICTMVTSTMCVQKVWSGMYFSGVTRTFLLPEIIWHYPRGRTKFLSWCLV